MKSFIKKYTDYDISDKLAADFEAYLKKNWSSYEDEVRICPNFSDTSPREAVLDHFGLMLVNENYPTYGDPDQVALNFFNKLSNAIEDYPTE